MLILSALFLVIFIVGLYNQPNKYKELRSWSGEVRSKSVERIGKYKQNFIYLFTGSTEIRLLEPAAITSVGDKLRVKVEYNYGYKAYEIKEMYTNGKLSVSYKVVSFYYIFQKILLLLGFFFTLALGVSRLKKYK